MCTRNHFLIPDKITSIALDNDRDKAINKIISNEYFIKNLFKYHLECMFIMHIVRVEELFQKSFFDDYCPECLLEYNDYGTIYSVVAHCVHRVLYINRLIVLLSEKIPLVVCGRLFGLLGQDN
jgi:hypothetical protein